MNRPLPSFKKPVSTAFAYQTKILIEAREHLSTATHIRDNPILGSYKQSGRRSVCKTSKDASPGKAIWSAGRYLYRNTHIPTVHEPQATEHEGTSPWMRGRSVKMAHGVRLGIVLRRSFVLLAGSCIDNLLALDFAARFRVR